jgi:molybdopterin converting factor small subunit
MKILYFGQLVDVTKMEQEELNDLQDLNALKVRLEEKYPLLKDKSYIFSVNQKVTQEAQLQATDEIALMPPFSGG